MKKPSLKDYLQAGYPLIHLQTTEYQAAEHHTIETFSCLPGVQGSNYRIATWKAISGIQVMNLSNWPDGKWNSGGQDCIDLLGALEWIQNTSVKEGASGTKEYPILVIFHNVREYVGSTPNFQALIDTAYQAKEIGSNIVLLGPPFSYPLELNNLVTRVEYPLPNQEEIVDTFRKISLKYRSKLELPDGRTWQDDLTETKDKYGHPEGFELSKEQEDLLQQAAKNSLGLDSIGAENAFCLAMVATQKVDLDVIQAQKEAEVKKSDVLEFVIGKEDMSAVGGMDAFKSWLQKRKGAFSDSARDYGLPYPKGILLAGIAGTGKSLAAKAVAEYLGLPLLRLDLGKIFRSLVGESLHGDSEVYFSETAKGERISRMTIREAFETNQRGYTLSYTDHGACCWKKVLDVIRHDRQEDFIRLTTRRGNSVVVTEGHSVFTRHPSVGDYGKFGDVRGKQDPEGGKLVPTEARSLKIGDRIAIPFRVRGPRKDQKIPEIQVCGFTGRMTDRLARLMGLWLADGSVNGKSIRISCSADEPEIIEFVKSFGPTSETWKGGKAVDLTLNGVGLCALFSVFGVITPGMTATRKRVPAWMFGMSDEIVGAFLSGYFSGDGSFSGHNLEVSSVSERLIHDIAFLLRRFCIVPYVKKRKEPGSGLCKGHNTNTAYRLILSKNLSLHVFQEYVGFMTEAKTKALQTRLDAYPKPNGYVRGRVRYSVMWDEVVNVKRFRGKDPYSYDLSVEDTEKFVSGGVIVHNSEAAIRLALQVAETVSPCVLWIDELERGLAGARGSGELDSGVTARVVGTLLTWRAETASPVMVVATANDITSLPSMVYRKGRFDEVWAVDLPKHEERIEIFRIHFTKRDRNPDDFSLDLLAEKTDGWVGAEIEAVIEEALFTAFSDGEREPTDQDLFYAIDETKPQSKRDVDETQAVHEWIEAHARNVSGIGEKTSSGPKKSKVRPLRMEKGGKKPDGKTKDENTEA